MYIPAASMGEYDSYQAPVPTKKKAPGLERSDSRVLGRHGSRSDLSRSGSRSQLNRAASQSYLRNYSPVPPAEEPGREGRRGSRGTAQDTRSVGPEGNL